MPRKRPTKEYILSSEASFALREMKGKVPKKQQKKWKDVIINEALSLRFRLLQSFGGQATFILSPQGDATSYNLLGLWREAGLPPEAASSRPESIRIPYDEESQDQLSLFARLAGISDEMELIGDAIVRFYQMFELQKRGYRFVVRDIKTGEWKDFALPSLEHVH